VLAEVQAREDPAGGARDALRTLDQALRLGPPIHAYHRRRERYLRQAGDTAGTDRKEPRAGKPGAPPAGGTSASAD